jgi:hypothetical protein
MQVWYQPSIQSHAAIMSGVYASLASFLKFGGRSSLSEAPQTLIMKARSDMTNYMRKIYNILTKEWYKTVVEEVPGTTSQEVSIPPLCSILMAGDKTTVISQHMSSIRESNKQNTLVKICNILKFKFMSISVLSIANCEKIAASSNSAMQQCYSASIAAIRHILLNSISRNNSDLSKFSNSIVQLFNNIR